MSEELEIVPPDSPSASGLEMMERASIDIQIATAKRYPRDIAKVKLKMMSYATLDEETAKACFYTLPARAGGDGKPIQGPSVRLAEIAMACYGHLRAGARVISNDGKAIVGQGVVHDLENNVCVAIERRRGILKKNGQPYSQDMQTQTANVVCSIGLRDAIFRVVPAALIKPVYEAAKKIAIGDAKTLVQRRAGCLEHFAKLGVSEAKVLAKLGVSHRDNITLEHIGDLIGYVNSIRDEVSSIDEIFNAPPPEADKQKAPAPGAKAGLAPNVIKALEAAYGGVEQSVNAYLLSLKRISDGQTFRDLNAADADQMLRNVTDILVAASAYGTTDGASNDGKTSAA